MGRRQKGRSGRKDACRQAQPFPRATGIPNQEKKILIFSSFHFFYIGNCTAFNNKLVNSLTGYFEKKILSNRYSVKLVLYENINLDSNIVFLVTMKIILSNRYSVKWVFCQVGILSSRYYMKILISTVIL